MAGVSSGSSGQEVDLNLAPIIDCFTVLIAFMLVSASFLAIGLLDAGIAAGGATSTEKKDPPPINITVELKPGHQFAILVTGKTKQTIPLAANSKGEWDLEGLSGHLNKLKTQWPGVNGAILNAENSVEYQDVIHAMEATRKALPAVMLGGF